MAKIGIIGAGIFGCTAAIELSKKGHDVTIFDRADNIFNGASTINHLRHHYGFHYPRSKDTVEEIKIARESFEKEYGDSISDFFDDYYGVSTIGSKTTPVDFIKFCDDRALPYEIKYPEDKYLEKSKIGTCVKVPERVYDPDILKGMILKKIKENKIRLLLNSDVINGLIDGKIKKITYSLAGKNIIEEFDFVINATYSNFNKFNKIFGFPRKTLLYEIVELLELSIPNQPKIGLTIMDGEFSSVLPRGEKGTFTLGHVKESVLDAVTTDDIDTFAFTEANKKSNKENILKKGIEDFPFLKEASIIRSLFVTRVVKANVDATDERPSEITKYGNGIFSIFGGKVITCVNIAKKITEMIDLETNSSL
ncbi:MAG: FAD-dependent oxidoreductase [Candidatus Pacearchaeota archaeon]|jgi:hypothetical protein